MIRHILLAASFVAATSSAFASQGEKKFNVKLNPVMVFAGHAVAAADYAINHNVSIGVAAAYVPNSQTEIRRGQKLDQKSTLGAGATVAYYGNGFIKDGWYVEGGLGFQQFDEKTIKRKRSSQVILDLPYVETTTAKGTSYPLHTIVGYRWVSASGLNFNIGGGIERHFKPVTYEVESALRPGVVLRKDTFNQPVNLTGEFKVGYAF